MDIEERYDYDGINLVPLKKSTIGYPGLAYTITFLSLLRTFTTCFDRHAPPLRTIYVEFTRINCQPITSETNILQHINYQKSTKNSI